MGKVKSFAGRNIVPIVFAVICALGVYLSGTGIPTILADLVNRFDRNALLVLSLIFPVISGMGLNFGIVPVSYTHLEHGAAGMMVATEAVECHGGIHRRIL